MAKNARFITIVALSFGILTGTAATAATAFADDASPSTVPAVSTTTPAPQPTGTATGTPSPRPTTGGDTWGWG
ncbi:hypothetical protein [Kitasatospora sp. NPDC101183]|uniref:hypothetical protein n=1 Tax=Kitasatospora sp. NPDC101183 TaxID=3364100 RepID=UPI0038143BC9